MFAPIYASAFYLSLSHHQMQNNAARGFGIDLRPGMHIDVDAKHQLRITLPAHTGKRRRLFISDDTDHIQTSDHDRDAAVVVKSSNSPIVIPPTPPPTTTTTTSAPMPEQKASSTAIWSVTGSFTNPCLIGPPTDNDKYMYCYTTLHDVASPVIVHSGQLIQLAYREAAPSTKGYSMVALVQYFTVDTRSNSIRIHCVWYYTRKDLIDVFAKTNPMAAESILEDHGIHHNTIVLSDHKSVNQLVDIMEIVQKEDYDIASVQFLKGDLVPGECSEEDLFPSIEAKKDDLSVEEKIFRDFLCASPTMMYDSSWGRQTYAVIQNMIDSGQGKSNKALEKILFRDDMSFSGYDFRFTPITESVSKGQCAICRCDRMLLWTMFVPPLDGSENKADDVKIGSYCKKKLDNLVCLLKQITDDRNWFSSTKERGHYSTLAKIRTRYQTIQKAIGHSLHHRDHARRNDSGCAIDGDEEEEEAEDNEMNTLVTDVLMRPPPTIDGASRKRRRIGPLVIREEPD